MCSFKLYNLSPGKGFSTSKGRSKSHIKPLVPQTKKKNKIKKTDRTLCKKRAKKFQPLSNRSSRFFFPILFLKIRQRSNVVRPVRAHPLRMAPWLLNKLIFQFFDYRFYSIDPRTQDLCDMNSVSNLWLCVLDVFCAVSFFYCGCKGGDFCGEFNMFLIE